MGKINLKGALGVFLLAGALGGFGLVGDVFAQDTDNSGSDGETIKFESPLEYETVDGVLTSAMTTIQGIVAALAILMIVVGGVMYITSAGGSQTDLAKKTIGAALIGLVIALAAPALLKEIYGIMGADEPSSISGEKSLYDIIVGATSAILAFIGALAILMIVVGGVMYIVSADSNIKETAKKTIGWAVGGLVIALVSLIIVKAIAGIF